MAVEDYRTTTVHMDQADQYMKPVRLNPDDVDGRVIKAVLTDDHRTVPPLNNLKARLTWNDQPENPANPGSYVEMTATSDESGTAAWSTPIPMAAARAVRRGQISMGVQILDGDTVIASRPFAGLIDASVLNTQGGKDWYEEQTAQIKAMAAQVQAMYQQVQQVASNFDLEIGTVTSGTPAAVTVRKNNGLNTLDFTLPKGDKGDQGDRGPSGVDTVRVSQLEPGALPTASVRDGVLYLGIPQGLRGLQGEQGHGLLIKGQASDASGLPASGNQIGDARLVGDHVYVWYQADGETAPAWHDAGQLQGPSGHGMWTMKAEHGKADTVQFTEFNGVTGVYKPIAGDVVLMPSGKVFYVLSVDATSAIIGDQYANLNVGEQGPKGDTGVTEVTVNMLAPDAQPTTQLEGQHLTLGIPRGQQGVQGDRGPSGVRSVTATVIEEGQQPDADYNADTGALTLKLPMGGVPGATPVIGANGNWWVSGVDTGKPSRGEPGSKGDPGEDGKQGPVGVTSATVTMLNENAEPTVSLANQQLRLGIPRGKTGEAGKDGVQQSDVDSSINEKLQDYTSTRDLENTYATKQYVADSINNLDTSPKLDHDDGTLSGSSLTNGASLGSIRAGEPGTYLIYWTARIGSLPGNGTTSCSIRCSAGGKTQCAIAVGGDGSTSGGAQSCTGLTMASLAQGQTVSFSWETTAAGGAISDGRCGMVRISGD